MGSKQQGELVSQDGALYQDSKGELRDRILVLRDQFQQKALRQIERFVLTRHYDEVMTIAKELKEGNVLPL